MEDNETSASLEFWKTFEKYNADSAIHIELIPSWRYNASKQLACIEHLKKIVTNIVDSYTKDPKLRYIDVPPHVSAKRTVVVLHFSDESRTVDFMRRLNGSTRIVLNEKYEFEPLPNIKTVMNADGVSLDYYIPKEIAMNIPNIGTILWQQKIINLLKNGLSAPKEPKVLLLHTGGTIGSSRIKEDGALEPVKVDTFSELVFRLAKSHKSLLNESNCIIIACDPLLDSSRMKPDRWSEIARLISKYIANGRYTGVVVTHGTDTMAYTAAALSFLLPDITIPVIVTASQLPLEEANSDGWNNLNDAFVLAGGQNKDKNIRTYCGVFVYFNRRLMLAPRVIKQDASGFDAFASPRQPAVGGVSITYDLNWTLLNRISRPYSTEKTRVTLIHHMRKVLSIHLNPGIDLESDLELHLKQERMNKNKEEYSAILIRSYGSGNGPDIYEYLQKLEEKLVPVFNVTECSRGATASAYEASVKGAINLHDMTHEAALAKLHIALGREPHYDKYEKVLKQSGKDLEILKYGVNVLIDECKTLKDILIEMLQNFNLKKDQFLEKVKEGIEKLDERVDTEFTDNLADDIRKMASKNPKSPVDDMLEPLYTYLGVASIIQEFPTTSMERYPEKEKEFQYLRRKIIYDHVINYMLKNIKGEQTTSLETRCAAISLY